MPMRPIEPSRNDARLSLAEGSVGRQCCRSARGTNELLMEGIARYDMYRQHARLLLLGGGRIDHRSNLSDSMCRKTTLLCVHTDRVFVGGNVDAIDFPVRDVTLNPLNLSAHLS